MMRPQIDCRFFSGYKPCGKNDDCSPACPHKQTGYPRILVIHLGALGAVLRATVILPSIKRQWPQAHISWITSPAAAPLLENNPVIDRIFQNNHDGILQLSNLSFDFTFCIDKSLTASGIQNSVKDCGEKRGFGVDSKTGSIVPLNDEAVELFETGLSNRVKFFGNKKPETQLITEALGLIYKRDEYVFSFTESEKQFTLNERNRLGLTGKKVIGLNTGCSDVIPYKKFSVEGWLKLIHVLASDFPRAKLMLLGGPEDSERNWLIAKRSTVPLVETPTETGLRNGMVYTALADSVVTGDSLGMHMAIALKKWVVCWFGPTCAHEIDFYGRGETVLTNASCSPCWKRDCSKNPMCYDLVDWDQISTLLRVKNCERFPLKDSAPDVSL